MALQGAGPLTTKPGRWLARRILNLTECFIARDSGTLRLVEGLGCKTRLMRAHDGIFLPDLETATITPAEEATIAWLTARTPGQRIIGFNLRLWFHFRSSILPYHWAQAKYQERSRRDMDQLIAAAVELVGRLRRESGARVVLLSMYEPGSHPWEDDLPYLQQIKEAFAADPDVVLVEEPLGLGAVCQLVARFDLMIGTRLHSTLTALRLGVPAINLAYTLKCRDIFADLGLAANAIALHDFMTDPGTVARLAAEVLADRAAPQRLRRTIAVRIEENVQVLRQVLTGNAEAPAATLRSAA
jgi:polysaccharide pyruvyl transferase WcaK-like protein